MKYEVGDFVISKYTVTLLPYGEIFTQGEEYEILDIDKNGNYCIAGNCQGGPYWYEPGDMSTRFKENFSNTFDYAMDII